jgi:hypothetical protein
VGFFDWFSPPKPAPVVIIRNVLGEEIDRVEGVRDLWGDVDLRGRNWSHAELSGMWLDGSDLTGANLFGARLLRALQPQECEPGLRTHRGGQFSASRSRGRGSSIYRRQACAIRRSYDRPNDHDSGSVRWCKARMVRHPKNSH